MVKRIAVDIGNSTIACGLFENHEVVSKWYHPISDTDGAAKSLSEKQRSENAVTVAISSVVPSAREKLVGLLKNEKVPTIAISLDKQKSITDTYPTLGHDRLANCVAALEFYVKDAADAAIVIDFGTATTLTGVSKAGRLMGGLITLGLKSTMQAIYSKTDQLPLLDVDKVFQRDSINPLATTTPEAILNGTVLGHIAMVEHWIAESKRVMDGSVVVVATGGLSHYFSDAFTGSIEFFDSDLTLKGINLIAEEAMDLADRA
jgi:type III pantothenate kinase